MSLQLFFERLRKARENLGLTQDAMALKVGVSKRSYCAYEAGETAPSAKLLAALAEMEIDVAHLLTGQHSQPVPPAQELPRQEQEWLALYRNSSEEVRAALKAAGNELTKPAKARGKAA